jgi:hypothetical protein
MRNSFSVNGVTYQQKMKRCRKATCGRCPHGPYWYAFWWDKGRTKCAYVGKSLPDEVLALPGVSEMVQQFRDGSATILDKVDRRSVLPKIVRLTPNQAKKLLRLTAFTPYELSVKKYLTARRLLINSAGHVTEEVRQLDQAWEVWMAYMGW